MEKAILAEKAQFSPEKFVKNTLCATEKSVVNLLCFQAGQELALHKHPNSDEIFLVTEGEAIITVGGESQKAGVGTLILGPADVEHGIANAGSGNLVVLAIQAPKP